MNENYQNEKWRISMKVFNTTGLCNPNKHYMVDISDRLLQIKKMIEAGNYFCINRARQYGKTTTLAALKQLLLNDYQILSLDFQNIDNDAFSTGGTFSQTIARLILDIGEFEGLEIPEEFENEFKQLVSSSSTNVKMDELFRIFRRWCLKSEKPIILIIDEVDSATNNQVFLDFLAQLRFLYLKRGENPKNKTFQSVILAGVTDVKHLKSKIREDEQHKNISPWNIATAFKLDMNLSQSGINKMLNEYELDHSIGMDTELISQTIFDYTNGYPVLVSRICQIIDIELVPDKFSSLEEAWTVNGIHEAVKDILSDSDFLLFQSLLGKLTDYPEMKNNIKRILMEGKILTYNADNEAIKQMEMYGFVKNRNNTVVIANRIFETRLYNQFLSEEEFKENDFSDQGVLEKNIFVRNGVLDVKLIIEHFISAYTQILGPLQEKFKEKDGRELFLLYIKPIINGTGNYYIEAETRDHTKTDVIIDYLGKQYIIELKIWHGPRYNEAGEKQLKDYLDYYNLSKGYMLSFNFNKKKEVGVHEVMVGDKILIEGIL